MSKKTASNKSSVVKSSTKRTASSGRASHPLRVALMGDTGQDIFTYYQPNKKGSADSRLARQVAHDVSVPSGVAFLEAVFEAVAELLPSKKNIAVHGVRPPIDPDITAQSTDQFLYFIKEYGKQHRIKQQTELERIHHASNVSAGTVYLTHEKYSELTSDQPGFKDSKNAFENTDVVLVHDGGGAFREPKNGEKGWDSSVPLLSSLKTFLDRDEGLDSRLIVDVFGSIPQLDLKESVSESEAKPWRSEFWNCVLDNEDRAKRVCVICSATPLRRAGAAISRRLSWEQTIEDFATELKLFPPLRELAKAGHLIVRFGISALLHISHAPDGSPRAKFHFVPLAKDGIVRDQISDGRIVGKNAFIAANLVANIALDRSDLDYEAIFRGGLTNTIRAYASGYDADLFEADPKKHSNPGKTLVIRLAKAAFKAPKGKEGGLFLYELDEKAIPGRDWDFEKDAGPVVGNVNIPEVVIDHPRGPMHTQADDWNILSHTLKNESDHASRINLAVAIARFGMNKVLNREMPNSEQAAKTWEEKLLYETLRRKPCQLNDRADRDDITLPPEIQPEFPGTSRIKSEREKGQLNPVYAPVIRFGKLTTVDRSEIESIRSIRNLIKTYVERGMGSQTSSNKPISIAVFGPPGSGKSFTVKEIAKSINASIPDGTPEIRKIEFNVSQFRGIEDLGEALKKIASLNNEGFLPLAIFDEFDSDFDGRPFGWLKYFLAPMQDGSFFDARQQIHLGRAIFAFAGGIHHRFEDFDPFPPAGVDTGEVSDRKRASQLNFREQKGPDFISRLRGHIDILGLNSDVGTNKPVIRRAILIRGLIEQSRATINEAVDGVSIIDDDILYAMLTIDRYRHGARSVQAVLEMCSENEMRIEKSSLPSRSQLNMHVDAEEFYTRLFRSRVRAHHVDE